MTVLTIHSAGLFTVPCAAQDCKISLGYSTRSKTLSSASLSFWASQVVLVAKTLPINAGDRDSCWIPGLGKSLGGRHGNPLQYSCLENPTDRGAWRATVHRVAKSETRLKRLSMHQHVRRDLKNVFVYSMDIVEDFNYPTRCYLSEATWE